MLDLPKRTVKRVAFLGLSGFFVVGGLNHFLNPQFYLAMMPPYLPAPRALVYISGVFPANLHMALNSEDFAKFASARALYARLPLQLVFIFWVYYATLDKS